MPDTPSKGVFRAECCACGTRPFQGLSMNSAMWEDIAIEEYKEVLSNAT
jgi:hypothetical protein